MVTVSCIRTSKATRFIPGNRTCDLITFLCPRCLPTDSNTVKWLASLQKWRSPRIIFPFWPTLKFQSPNKLNMPCLNLCCWLCQLEYRPAAFALAPDDLGIDQACARTHVRQTTTFMIASQGLIEVATIVFDDQIEITCGRNSEYHLNFCRIRMTANVVNGFLSDSIDLHLHIRRKPGALFECFIAHKFILELPFAWRVPDRM